MQSALKIYWAYVAFSSLAFVVFYVYTGCKHSKPKPKHSIFINDENEKLD